MSNNFKSKNYRWVFHLIMISGIPVALMFGSLIAMVYAVIVAGVVFSHLYQSDRQERADKLQREGERRTQEVDNAVREIYGDNNRNLGLQDKPEIIEEVLIAHCMPEPKILGQIQELIQDLGYPNDKTPGRKSLYLRPFDSTNRFVFEQVVQNNLGPAGNLINPDRRGRERQKDLERIYAEALQDIARLEAMGRPGEHEGAIRVESRDEDHVWKNKISYLMMECIPIFILPSSNQGTVWEMTRAKELGVLSKTIFIMPAGDQNRNKEYREYWDYHAERLKVLLGVELPKYYSSGAWFRFDENWKVRDIIEDGVPGWASIAERESESIQAAKDQILEQLKKIFSYNKDDKAACSLVEWQNYIEKTERGLNSIDNIFTIIGVVVIIGLIIALIQ